MEDFNSICVARIINQLFYQRFGKYEERTIFHKIVKVVQGDKEEK